MAKLWPRSGSPDVESSGSEVKTLLVAVIDKLSLPPPSPAEPDDTSEDARLSNPASMANVNGLEGLAYSLHPRWLEDPSLEGNIHGQKTAADISASDTITFHLYRELDGNHGSPPQPTRMVSVPLANTLFQTGQLHTVVSSKWKETGSAYRLVSKRNSSQPPLNVYLKNVDSPLDPCDHQYVPRDDVFIPLASFVPTHIVRESNGNVISKISLPESGSTSSIPASHPLQSAMSTYLSHNDSTDGPPSVWALVIPRGLLQQDERLSDWFHEMNRVLGPQCFPKYENGGTPPLFQPFFSGAKFCRILSGGGEWGSKAGLITLEPDSNLGSSSPELDLDEDGPLFIDVMFQRIANPGDYILFYVLQEPENVLHVRDRPLHLDEKAVCVSSIDFGVARSSTDEIDDESTVPASSRIETWSSHFGVISEGSISVTDKHISSQIASRRYLSIPSSRFSSQLWRSSSATFRQPRNKMHFPFKSHETGQKRPYSTRESEAKDHSPDAGGNPPHSLPIRSPAQYAEHFFANPNSDTAASHEESGTFGSQHIWGTSSSQPNHFHVAGKESPEQEFSDEEDIQEWVAPSASQSRPEGFKIRKIPNDSVPLHRHPAPIDFHGIRTVQVGSEPNAEDPGVGQLQSSSDAENRSKPQDQRYRFTKSSAQVDEAASPIDHSHQAPESETQRPRDSCGERSPQFQLRYYGIGYGDRGLESSTRKAPDHIQTSLPTSIEQTRTDQNEDAPSYFQIPPDLNEESVDPNQIVKRNSIGDGHDSRKDTVNQPASQNEEPDSYIIHKNLAVSGPSKINPSSTYRASHVEKAFEGPKDKLSFTALDSDTTAVQPAEGTTQANQTEPVKTESDQGDAVHESDESTFFETDALEKNNLNSSSVTREEAQQRYENARTLSPPLQRSQSHRSFDPSRPQKNPPWDAALEVVRENMTRMSELELIRNAHGSIRETHESMKKTHKSILETHKSIQLVHRSIKKTSVSMLGTRDSFQRLHDSIKETHGSLQSIHSSIIALHNSMQEDKAWLQCFVEATWERREKSRGPFQPRARADKGSQIRAHSSESFVDSQNFDAGKQQKPSSDLSEAYSPDEERSVRFHHQSPPSYGQSPDARERRVPSSGLSQAYLPDEKYYNRARYSKYDGQDLDAVEHDLDTSEYQVTHELQAKSETSLLARSRVAKGLSKMNDSISVPHDNAFANDETPFEDYVPTFRKDSADDFRPPADYNQEQQTSFPEDEDSPNKVDETSLSTWDLAYREASDTNLTPNEMPFEHRPAQKAASGMKKPYLRRIIKDGNLPPADENQEQPVSLFEDDVYPNKVDETSLSKWDVAYREATGTDVDSDEIPYEQRRGQKAARPEKQAASTESPEMPSAPKINAWIGQRLPTDESPDVSYARLPYDLVEKRRALLRKARVEEIE